MLDRDTLDLLERSIEVDVRTRRGDGSTSSRPIWVVVDDGQAYVRSYRGAHGAWYRRALADGRMTIAVDGTEIPVTVEPVGGDDLNRSVSEAFRAKYGEISPRPTEEMVAPEIEATTLRLAPA